MKETIIAFDVDGTLFDENDNINTNLILIMIGLYNMKNIKIIIWSGGGKEYAERKCKSKDFNKYVSGYYSKLNCPLKVDIAFDDVDDFNLANKNIIVN